MGRIRWLTGVLVVGAMGLAGCSMEYGTQVSDNGSGRLTISVGFTSEEAELLEIPIDQGVNLCQEMWADLSSQLPAGATIREEQRGNETWCIVESTFSDLDELSTIYADMDISINRLEIVNEMFYYDVSIDLSGGDDLGFPIDFIWTLTVPGVVGANNADESAGQTLTWNLAIGQVNTMRAESSLGVAWVWWVVGALGCLCLTAIAFAAGVGLFIYLRRKPS